MSLYERAIKKWGMVAQIDMMIEEAGELIVALQHFKRGRDGSLKEVIEEIIDTELMIEQGKLMFTYDEHWQDVRRMKLERLEALLK